VPQISWDVIAFSSAEHQQTLWIFNMGSQSLGVLVYILGGLTVVKAMLSVLGTQVLVRLWLPMCARGLVGFCPVLVLERT
jgi:hypothetical protein